MSIYHDRKEDIPLCATCEGLGLGCCDSAISRQYKNPETAEVRVLHSCEKQWTPEQIISLENMVRLCLNTVTEVRDRSAEQVRLVAQALDSASGLDLARKIAGIEVIDTHPIDSPRLTNGEEQ